MYSKPDVYVIFLLYFETMRKVNFKDYGNKNHVYCTSIVYISANPLSRKFSKFIVTSFPWYIKLFLYKLAVDRIEFPQLPLFSTTMG